MVNAHILPQNQPVCEGSTVEISAQLSLNISLFAYTIQSVCVLVRGTRSMENQCDHASGQNSALYHLRRLPPYFSNSHPIPSAGEADGS